MYPICTNSCLFIKMLVGGHGGSHTFVEINHEIIYTSRRVNVVSYKQHDVHEVQNNRLVKLAQERSVVM